MSADKTVGGRTREEWDRFAETYYGYVLPTAQLKELISEAFDSRGIRDGLERAAEWHERRAAAKEKFSAMGATAAEDRMPLRWSANDHRICATALRAEASKLDGLWAVAQREAADSCYELNGPGVQDDCRSCRGRALLAKRAPEPPAEERKLPLGRAVGCSGFKPCDGWEHCALPKTTCHRCYQHDHQHEGFQPRSAHE